MTIHATYENGVFRPTQPVELPEHCQVELVISKTTPPQPEGATHSPLARLAAIAGMHPQNPNLPVDLAAQHDHYLYGTAKRS